MLAFEHPERARNTTRCELRGCVLDGLVGAERLAGARLPLPDVVAAAGTLASALGIQVVD